MRDILHMIDFLHICFFQHIDYLFQSVVDAEVGRSGDSEGIFVEQFFRDFDSDLILFEEIQYLFPELCFILFQNFRIVDEIVFIDEEHHPFFDDQFPFLVDKQGDHSLIFSDLDFHRIRIFAEFGARVGTDFIKQFWNFSNSFIISGYIAYQAEHSRLEDMTQERVSQSSSFSRTFDEPRNIDDIEMSLLHGDRT